MSLRQQIRYLMDVTTKKNEFESKRVTQDAICELKDYIQDEEIRKKHPSIEKLEERNRLIDEAQRTFKPIRKTIYLERKQVKLSIDEIMMCDCKKPWEIKSGDYEGLLTIGCGNRCLNRIVSTECCASFCAAGDRCTNRRFQLQQHAQVYPIKTYGRGWGLAAGQPIRKGQFVIQYIGEVYNITSDIGLARQIRYRSSECTYLMSVCHNEVIDPTRKGNLARFINHSCNPNCETQKWNVMGEVCIGIFAKRNIEEDEELSFDYSFDTHKTRYTKCLCGAPNCQIYLGLVKMPENESSSETKCHICQQVQDDDDIKLINCDNCSKGFHKHCLDMPSNISPSFWICNLCRVVSEEPVAEPEALEQQAVIQLQKYQFEFLKHHLNGVELDVRIFWENSYDNSSITVHIRGDNADAAKKRIEKIIENSTEVQKIEDQIISIEIKVQKILFNLAFKFCKKVEAEFQIEGREKVSHDEIFPINQVSSFFLTGRSLTVYGVAEKVLDYIDHLVIFTMTITQTEAKKIESDLLSLNNMVYPAEIRLSKEKTMYNNCHPNYSNQFEERKLVYIGTEEQIQPACRTINCWLSERIGSEIETNYSFLLPLMHKNHVKRYKIELLEHMKKLNPQIMPNVIIYEPNINKKFLTVSLIGSWNQILLGKNNIIKEIIRMSGDNDLDLFFTFTQSQIFKTVLRSIVKFVHGYEKKKSDRRLHIMKFWDLYSSELILPMQLVNNIDKFRGKIVSHFSNDTELLVYSLRLCESYEQINNILMITFKLTSSRIFEIFESYLETFPPPSSKSKSTYHNKDCTILYDFLIDQENSLELDLGRDQIILRALMQARLSTLRERFLLFPTSFGSDPEKADWEPDLDSKLGDYLQNLENRTILLGTKLETPQIVSNTPVIFEAKEKADVMVGCFNAADNILYVMFSDRNDIEQ